MQEISEAENSDRSDRNLKSKKKRNYFVTFFKWFCISILILIVSLFFLAQSAAVQTWLAKKAAEYLSTELKVPVEIDAVSIGFFNSVSLRGFLVRDLKKDTLLYAGKLYVNAKKIEFSSTNFQLEVSGIENSTIKLKRYEKEKDFNFQFIVDYFSPKETKKDTTSKLKIDFGRLKLKQINFTYTDYNDLKRSSSMNFSDLHVQDLNGTVDEIIMKDDTIELQFSDFSFREKSGFVLDQMATKLLVCPTTISMHELFFISKHSYLHGQLQLKQFGYDDFSDFTEKVSVEIELMDTSHFGLMDLHYFSGLNFTKNDNVYLKGKINGKVNEFNGKEIQLKYGNSTFFAGNFNVTDITMPDQMYLHLNIKSLSTAYHDLVRFEIPGTNITERSSMFSSLKPLGKISYLGKIDGFLNEIASKGALTTSIGFIQCDASLTNLVDSTSELGYAGYFSMNSLDIGKFLNNKEVGKLNASLQVEGSGTSIEKLNAHFDFKIQSMVIHGYDYHAMDVNGVFNNKKFNGLLTVKDTNAKFTFSGSVNLNDKYTDMDFKADVENLDFVKLHFSSPKDSIQKFQSKMMVNLRGNDLASLSGKIIVDSLSYSLNSKTYFLSSLNLLLNQNSLEKSIEVNSDYLDLDITGKFNLSDIPSSFRKFTENYFPTFIKDRKIPKNKILTDNFTFSVRLKNFNKINGLIAPELNISDGATLSGRFDISKNEFSVLAQSNKIAYGDIVLTDWKLDGVTKDKSIILTSGADKIKVTDSLFFDRFRLTSLSTDTTSDFSLAWSNSMRKKNSGDVSGKIFFQNESFLIKLLRSDITIADSIWSIYGDGNSIIVDTSGAIVISDLNINNGEQEIKATGKISNNDNDLAHLEITKFKLVQLNPLLSAAQMKLDGSVSGFCDLSGVFGKLILTSDFNFSKIHLNDKELGGGKIKSFYDARRDVVGINGFLSKGNILNGVEFKNIEFVGEYFPSRQEDNLDVSANFKNFDITVIQPYLSGVITFAKQRGASIDGVVSVKGKISKPLVTGKINFSAKNFRIDYLNTIYTANGIIKLFPDKIQFGDDEAVFTKLPEPITLSDKEGHEAELWGNIFHDNFSITKLDFDINAKNFQALNTTAVNNPGYFGKAYVSGNLGVYGDVDNINFNINVKTEKNTEFNIPLSGPATVEENDYMFFVKKDSLQKDQTSYTKSLSGINLNFNLEATPDASVKLIFDSKSGDVIQANGSGNINMVINTNGKFEMSGLYTLDDGNYLFSLENLLSKKFDIVSGSTIKWTGDPLNADINITAGYNQNSSLTPFFPSDSTGLYTKPVRASVLLNLKDKLLTPDISFGIQLPTVDETTRQTVLSYINNEQELNRQVFSLLLLKSFVTPLQLSNQGVGVGAGSAASRTSSEMLSNQLSNWLSQLSTNIDISVNITPEQMDVALSKQLFNDRLSIDGNVGVNNAAGQKTTNMIGDLQVDYKVYPDGKLRVKGFNKSNDNTQISTLGGPFTQGMGLFYREEFNTVDELYQKYLGWVRKRKRN